MKLSEHLSLSEVERSDIAIYQGFDNRMPNRMMSIWQAMALKIFEPLRETYGEPIFVTSGYRCQSLQVWLRANRGASVNSQHRGLWMANGTVYDCAALDLWVPDSEGMLHIRDLFQYGISGLGSSFRRLNPVPDFDQLIIEFIVRDIPSWIHVSYVKGIEPRREILRSYREADEIVYRTLS